MRLGELLQQFQGMKALVVGDLMLDEYIFGRATRISPEAPVMVVRQQKRSAVPGGAANVAKNLCALGAETQLFGVVGADEPGTILRNALLEAGLEHSTVLEDSGRPTTRKTRVLADSAHQVLRIDHEDTAPLSPSVEEQLLAGVADAISGSQVVVLSDYQKGVLTDRVVREVIRLANAASVPVVANAKPKALRSCAGATLISVNRVEAVEASGNSALDGFGNADLEAVKTVAQSVCERVECDHVLITLGGQGMCTESFSVPAVPVEVFDTAGAGDTVIATVALGIGAIGFRQEVFHLASHTSASVVRKVGVAVPSKEDLHQISSYAVE